MKHYLTGEQKVWLIVMLSAFVLLMYIVFASDQDYRRGDDLQKECIKIHGTWDHGGCKAPE